jgi:hypothetical protein
VKDEVYGALTLYFHEAGEFSTDQVELASAFANQAALATENARLHEESEQRRNELEALYHADQALHRSVRTEEVLDVPTDLPVALGQAQIVSMLLWDEQQQRFVVGSVRGLSDEMLRETFTLTDLRIPHGATRDIVEIDDAPSDPRVSDRACMHHARRRACMDQLPHSSERSALRQFFVRVYPFPHVH